MGRSQSVKFQIQLMEKYVQLMEKMLANGEKLNKGQIQAINNNAKEFRRYSLKETQEKNSLKKAMDKNKLSREEFKVRKDLKSADESLVRLRSALRMQEEREHGAQVRRNIVLRDKQESFHKALGFTKNALTGGFGFSDALGRIVKSAATTTKQFNEIRRSSLSLSDAQKKYQKSLTDISVAQMAGDPKKIKIAEDAANVAKMDMMSKFDQASENQLSGGSAENKNTKPIFEKLSKLGDFLNKKKVPIGIGLGVAGVLISVIVKAFSASPLFAAMMKMMKFMVQLILMPIGTFFGALLRPILIMLLRKFIIPWYSSMMPKAISIGTAVGNFLTDPWGGLKSAIFGDGDGDGNIDLGDDTELTPSGDIIDKESGEVLNEDEFVPVPPVEIPDNSATPYDPEQDFQSPTNNYDDKVTSKNNEEDQRSKKWWEVNVWEPLTKFGNWLDTFVPRVYGEEQIPPYAGSLEHVFGGDGTTDKNASDSNIQPNEHTWGNGEGLPEYVNPVIENAESVLTENQKMIQRYIKNPDVIAQEANFKKAKEDYEKKLKQEENQKRISESLKKPNIRNIDQVIADQAARNAQQETVNTENTKYAGTQSAGKLSSSLNAGANVGAAMKKNASKGHVNLSTSNMNLSQATRDLLASMNSGIIPAAEGFDGMVNSPTLFMAGEAGAEHVKVTPNGQGGGGNITVNIQNMNGSDDDLRKLKKTILEVIQQSANNRGRI